MYSKFWAQRCAGYGEVLRANHDAVDFIIELEMFGITAEVDISSDECVMIGTRGLFIYTNENAVCVCVLYTHAYSYVMMHTYIV